MIAADAVSKLVCHFADPKIGAVAGNAKVGNRVNLWTRWQALEYITSQNFRAARTRSVQYRHRGSRRDRCLADRSRAAGWFLPGQYRRRRCRFDHESVGAGAIRSSTRWIVRSPSPRRRRPRTALMRQRFRWSFGTLQAIYKHQRAFLKNRAMGLFALPNNPGVSDSAAAGLPILSTSCSSAA